MDIKHYIAREKELTERLNEMYKLVETVHGFSVQEEEDRIAREDPWAQFPGHDQIIDYFLDETLKKAKAILAKAEITLDK